jgi:hypothetical protein
MKFFDMTNTDPIPDDKFKNKFFFYSISVSVNKITNDLYLRCIIDNTIDPQTGII